VVGAGHESYYLPIPAHFSRSVEIFYRLEGRGQNEKYVRDSTIAKRHAASHL
jgi:hypothetical protein